MRGTRAKFIRRIAKSVQELVDETSYTRIRNRLSREGSHVPYTLIRTCVRSMIQQIKKGVNLEYTNDN